jgi:hypothetical protein
MLLGIVVGEFVRNPCVACYGIVAVFADLYGYRWDLIELSAATPEHDRAAS